MQKKWDVVALGEVLLHLEPNSQRILQQTQQLDLMLGGSESNTLVGLSGLGKTSCLLSRLPRNAVGEWGERQLCSHRIDTSHFIWGDEQERLGLYFVRPATGRVAQRIVYDCTHSAMGALRATDLDLQLFQADQARLFHTSAATLSYGQTLCETAEKAWTLAGEAKWSRSFIFNFRHHAWEIDDAWLACLPFMMSADVVFISLTDAQLAINQPNLKAKQCAEQLRQLLANPLIVITSHTEGALAYTGNGTMYCEASREELQRYSLGCDDAFVAGFLAAWLDNEESVNVALLQAVLCAIHQTTSGGVPHFTSEDIAQMSKTL